MSIPDSDSAAVGAVGVVSWRPWHLAGYRPCWVCRIIHPKFEKCEKTTRRRRDDGSTEQLLLAVLYTATRVYQQVYTLHNVIIIISNMYRST